MESATARPLRAWQRAALDLYVERGSPRDFLVTATPGAGKTAFALILADQLLAARVVDQVVVVVPTDHLRGQWAGAAAADGLCLDAALGNDAGMVGSDYRGYVATYAQVAGKPVLHRRRVEHRRTLVILDEIHHAGDGLSWGDAVLEAFEPAKRRLSLTGTPFRSKPTETIPFVTYTPGEGGLVSTADHTYGYRDALADRVVRPVLFAAYTGVTRWRNGAGDVVAASLSEPLTRDMELRAWRTALSPTGQWIPHVVGAADERLSQIRASGMPDAGAMILASDQDSARAYAQIVHRVTGEKPTLVLSDEAGASKRIAAFSASSSRWLVAVRMVSEGVDVPRLAVGVWATNYRAPLFFAQAVGRFVRARRPGETATIFLPAVRPLLALAADMETDRDHVVQVRHRDDEGFDEVIQESPEQASDHLDYEALDAEAQFAHVLYAGRTHTADPSAAAPLVLSDAEQDYLGLPGLLDPQTMAALLQQRETNLRRTVQQASTTRPSVGNVGDQIIAVRQEITSLVSQVASRAGMQHAQVHRELRRAVPGPGSAQATLAQLEARRNHLLGMAD